MAYQAIFKRYELKYMITKAQKEIILSAIQPYMTIDEYGRTTIRNVYFDTDNYRLIRASIEKPMYKEKLRIRSYELATEDSKVFVELKKKYDHVVYKRRISMSEGKAMDWLCNGQAPEVKAKKEQIASEIDYFISFYESLRPSVFLSYEREAFKTNIQSDFRVTFDDTILFRTSDMSLKEPAWGKSLLDEDKVLMEIKCSGGIPLWMTEVLSRERIYKTSFSKYGTAYREYIFPALQTKNKERILQNANT